MAPDRMGQTLRVGSQAAEIVADLGGLLAIAGAVGDGLSQAAGGRPDIRDPGQLRGKGRLIVVPLFCPSVPFLPCRVMLPAATAAFRVPRLEVLLKSGMQFRLVVFNGQHEVATGRGNLL